MIHKTQTSRVFDAAANDAPECPAVVRQILMRFQDLKSEGANDRGEVFDFVHSYEPFNSPGDTRHVMHSIVGFFKRPGAGEDLDKSLVGFPALNFSVMPMGEVYNRFFTGEYVDREAGIVTVREIDQFFRPNMDTLDEVICHFVRTSMTNHPAQKRLIAAQIGVLSPPRKTTAPEASPQTPEA